MSRPSVTVVMPFAGDGSAARAATHTLLSLQVGARDQLILADNSGTASDAATGPVTLIAAAGERSPAHARNAGAAHARNDWILFLDSDCLAPPDLLDLYFAPPVGDDVGALAGEVRAAPGAATLAARYGAARGFLGQEAHLSHPYRPRAVAANLLVRRTAFEQIGGFYEGVRAAEDTDFSWRLQAAGWKLELRRRAAVEHRYRTTIGDLRSQWRGYAAGRAWLGRRYQGFEPEPAVARASGRAWRRLRRKPADRRRTASREAIRVGRLERGGYAMLDAVLSAEELAGLMMSNRPSGTRTPPARVVLIADRFPARGDPLARVRRHTRRRPDRGLGAPGVARDRPRALAAGRLPRGRRRRGSRARGARAGACAPAAVRRRSPRPGAGSACACRDRAGGEAPAARPRRRRAPARRGHRGDRAANRAARGPAAGRAMRVHVVDPSSFTRPYDHGLCSALARAGAEVELITCEFPYGTAPSPDGYVLREPFYRHALGPGEADCAG